MLSQLAEFPRTGLIGSPVSEKTLLIGNLCIEATLYLARQNLDSFLVCGHVLRKGSGYELRAVHRAPGTKGARGATDYLKAREVAHEAHHYGVSGRGTYGGDVGGYGCAGVCCCYLELPPIGE